MRERTEDVFDYCSYEKREALRTPKGHLSRKLSPILAEPDESFITEDSKEPPMGAVVVADPSDRNSLSKLSNVSTIPSGDRPNGPVYPDYEAVTVSVSGTKCTFKPIVEGFDHPYRRGWMGADQCQGASTYKYYAVSTGFDPGIFNSRAGAWVRTADFEQVTGVRPIFKGFRTYQDAVQFLGYDPDTEARDPDLPRYQPPRRISSLAVEYIPDPHNWCGVPPSSAPDHISRPRDASNQQDPDEDENSATTGSSKEWSLFSKTSKESKHTSSTESSEPSARSDLAPCDTGATLPTQGNAMQTLADTLLAAINRDKPTVEQKQEAILLNLLTKETSDKLPKLDKGPNSDQVSLWQMLMIAQLNTPMWLVDDTNILTMEDDGELTEPFRLRTRLLGRLLVQRLGADHYDVIQNNMDLVKSGRGVSLYHAIVDHLDPNNEATSLSDFRLFVDRVQLNGETVATLARALMDRHRRLAEAGFDLGPRVLLLQLVRAVLDGAYGNTPAFKTFSNDIIHQKLKLSEETFDSFAKRVKGVMMAANLLEHGVAKKLPATAIARRVGGGSISPHNTLDGDPVIGQMRLSSLDIESTFKRTKCPICRIPRGHKDEHHVSECPELKKRGVRGMHYDRKFDEARKAREGPRKDPPLPSDRAPGETQNDGLEDASKNAGSAKRVVGNVKRVGVSNPYDVLGDDESDDESPYSDAHVDANNIKDVDSEHYMHSVYDSLIAISPDPVYKCIGSCRKVSSSNNRPGQDTLCADSGATSDMFAKREHFTSDYRQCNNVYVTMGDGSPVPVLGIGTARFKVDGYVLEIPNALHVPNLDCNLLSITRHGLRGPGCTYLVANGSVHITFPEFNLSMGISADGDPRFKLQPISLNDEGRCDFSGGTLFNPFGSKSRRVAFVRRMHRARLMTRTQRKKAMQRQKHVILDISAPTTMPNTRIPRVPPSKTEKGIDEVQLRLDNTKNTTEAPPQFTPESARSKKERYTTHELQTLFGGREIKDYGILTKLGTGITVANLEDNVPSVGKLVNRKRGRRTRTRERILQPNSVVGMDIGYGPSTSPGGFKYCLILVDYCTTNTWIFGMKGTSGNDIQEALWKFFIEARGFPRKIQCDFDPRFLGGQAKALLQAHGCSVTAAPPNRQSQNGKVEKRWQLVTTMARTFLADAKLPTKFWYWAAREAATRLNILPITSNPKDPSDILSLTTPHEAFYGTQPDYRILFPFGCLGGFRRYRDGTRSRNKFESQSMLGIAVGRSEHTNGMIFYNPTLDSFSTSADYYLDRNRLIGEEFPSLLYDGGLTTSVWSSNRRDVPSKYDVGETVYILDDTQNVQSGTITMPPTSVSQNYSIALESGITISAATKDIYTEFTIPATGTPSESLGFFTPSWLKQGAKVTVLIDNEYLQGYLGLDKDYFWEFSARDKNGHVATRIPLPDLNYSWKDRIQQNTLRLGWQNDIARKVCGTARHVSASSLTSTLPPANLLKAFAAHNPDAPVWRAAYDEEHDGLTGLDTFVEIGEVEYQALVAKHGEAAKAIPTMNLFTVKNDSDGNPVRAKSRIVVLGNLEKRMWEKIDRYAPVINASSSRLLVSMAVEQGRKLKQGDCKNAFCQPEMPEDEITIVKPPKGCPRSKPGTYWKLNKTLYGLSRSPKHWYETFRGHLEDMGFKPVSQDPCVFKCTPFAGKPPIYLGMYVDDFVYFSTSDHVEEWFETTLESKLRVDFMGPVSWFLGCHYDWHSLPDGRLTCHISQQAFSEQLIERFGMEHCTPSERLYKSGLVIDRIDRDNFPATAYAEFTKEYQSLMGGLQWLVTNTRPDLNVAVKLLSQFTNKPSVGHRSSGNQVLRYLRATASYGIWYTQGERRLEGHVSFPDTVDPNTLLALTDSNWGPQDASKPKPNDTRTVRLDELNSVQGYYITRMGGPISWGVHREGRISGSSCEAEIKAMDLGTKSIQFLRRLSDQIGLTDAAGAVPVVLNDNKGAVDWTNNGCILTKRFRHSNLHEGRVAEAKLRNEISVHWVPGKENPADLFTKEIADIGHFQTLRDLMVRPREWVHQEHPTSPDLDTYSTANVKSQKKKATQAAKKTRRVVDDSIVFVGTVPVGERDWIMGGAKIDRNLNPSRVEGET